MNRFLTILGIILLAAVSCKKVSGPANGNSIQPNNHIDSTVTFSALVNNLPWKTDSAYGYIVRSSANDSAAANLLITATIYADTPSTIAFNISNYSGAGTYIISPPANSATYYLGNSRFTAKAGSITITVNQLVVRNDTGYSLTGVFSFSGTGITVTNGVFNVAHP